MRSFNNNIIKLDSAGLSHFFIPLLIIITVAIGGTFMLVSSKASSRTADVFLNNQPYCPAGWTEIGVGKNNTKNCTKKTTCPSGWIASGANPPCKKASKKPKPPKTTDADHRIATGNPNGGDTGSDTASDGGPAAKDQAPTGSVKITDPKSSKALFEAKSKPSGDIIAVTYINDPEIDKKGDKDHRIGGFKVKVERVGGPNNCDNTKKIIGTTNKTKKLTPKGEKVPVLVHGTVHFLNCDAGKYKATIMKPYRGGTYNVISPTVREFTLDDNATEVPFFVVEKKTKGKTTPAPMQAPATGNGGVTPQI